MKNEKTKKTPKTKKPAPAKKPVEKKAPAKTGRPKKSAAVAPVSKLQQAYDTNRNWGRAAQQEFLNWDGKRGLKNKVAVATTSLESLIESVGVMPLAPELKRIVDETVAALPPRLTDLCIKELDSEIEIDALRLPGVARNILLLLNTVMAFNRWCAGGFSPALFVTVAVRLQACEEAGIDIYGAKLLEKYGPLVYEDSAERRTALKGRDEASFLASMMAEAEDIRHDD